VGVTVVVAVVVADFLSASFGLNLADLFKATTRFRRKFAS
jgi:hypothetical protein